MQKVRPAFLTIFAILFGINLSAQVNADFSFSNTSGCGSLQVSFCDNSITTADSIVSWTWDLGGAPSSLECPGRIFGTPGKFTICLTVTDSDGNSDTECKTDLVTVFKLPQPDFEADPTIGCSPVQVTFTDLSTSEDGTITNWLWGLGGSCGTISTTNPSVPAAVCTYTIPDDYTVSLTVTDDNGCVNTKTKTDLISVEPAPEALFSVQDTFGCEPPFTTTFTNESPFTAGVDFEWDFGPGNGTFSGENPPPVSFNSTGSHTVTLIARNSASSCSDTITFENLIDVGYLVDFDFTPSTGCPGLMVSFTDESTEAADSVIWDFGDGNFSNEANPVHQYDAPGCYYVKLTREVDGCFTERWSPSCINVQAPPALSYNNDNNVGCTLPHVVNFAGLSQDAASWKWYFGDGDSSSIQNPTHIYDEFGDFPVTLVVTSTSGCVDSVTLNTIEVQPVQAALVDDNIEGCAPMSVTLGENSSSVTAITDWNWQIVTPTSTYISSSASPTFTINDIGVFDVTLTVTNTLGCSDTQTFPGAISVGSIPTLNFSATPTESCVEMPIQFTDLSDATVDFWYWDFGDGGDSDEQNPVYYYLDTGYYDVNLIASYNGCINSITFDDYIHITAPVAKYSVIKFCDDTYQRKFKDNSVGADSVFWDFGVPGTNTDTSTLANPDFTYPDTGYYYASLTVYNFTTGCEHTKTEEIYITDPKANFTVSTTQGCSPLTIQLTDQSDQADTYLWSSVSGDISDPYAANPSVLYNTPGEITNDLQLVIKDVNNCRDTFVFDQSIYNNQIYLGVNVDPGSGCPTLDVDFEDSSLNLFANNIEWGWVFGNNLGTSDLEDPSFSFPDVGAYDIEHTVTDDWGCTQTATFAEIIQVSEATAFFDVDNVGCTSHPISFNNYSDGENLTFEWDFGDGSPISTEEFPSHYYQNDGSYTVCLTVRDENACINTYCLDTPIEVTDPVAGFTVDNNFASCPPLTVNFNNLSINATDYLWDFGDGSGLQNMENPTHVYTTPGSFEVTLIASNSPDCHDTITFDDLVILDGPVGEFSYSIDSTCVPAEITFMASSVADYEYTWDMGEGTIISNPGNYIQSDTFTFVYNQAGVYTPTLSLENSTGCFRTLPEVGSIYVSTLEPEFLASETLQCDGAAPITFYNFSNTVDSIISVEWIFENGSPAMSNNIEEIVDFNGSGSFDVTMIVSNGFCTDTLTKVDYINIGESPVANFLMSTDLGCDPLPVSFTDQSSIANGAIGNWQWDFGDGNGSNQSNPDHTFSAGASIPVTLVVFSEEGCTDTLTQTIEVLEAPDVFAGNDLEICMGAEGQIEAQINGNSAGLTYSWSPATGLSCTDCLNPIATPSTTTTYTLTVSNPGGCVSTSEITVDVLPYSVPTISITADTTICLNEIIQLQVDGGSNVYSYNWDTNIEGLSCYESCLNPIASPLESTTYTVTVTNEWGCSAEASVNIGVLDESQEFLGTDKTICEGASTQLNIGIGTDPVWLVTDGLNCASCPNPVATPEQATEYIARVTTDNGCKIYDTLLVEIMYPEDIEAGDDIVICRGETITLAGIGEGSVNWSPGGNITDPGTYSPMVNPASTTTYFMAVTKGECTQRDSVLVEVTDKTDVDVDDVIICEGETVELVVEGRADSYEWLPSDDLSDLNSGNPFVSPEETTTYTVTATLATCEPDIESVTVTVLPAPEVILDNIVDYFPGQEVQLDVTVNGSSVYAYDWSPLDGISCVSCSNPFVDPELFEYYSVIVTDLETGCATMDSVSFNLLESCPEELIAVPNIFTPNDDGYNDELKIFLSSTLGYDIISYRIFDRWGSLVFETNDLNEGWNGKYKGKPMPDGVYIYVVEVPCELTGTRIIKKGDFTLLR